MSHGTEHHLEEAEHSKHHAIDPFTQRVAMTMAIIAAALAFVAMLSHRKHNDVITRQLESTAKFTEASNKWSQYQAKRMRSVVYEASADMLEASTGKSSESGASAEKLINRWRGKMQEYDRGDPKWKEKAERREEAKALAADGKDDASMDPDSLPNLQTIAEGLIKQSETAAKNAETAHHQANYLDSGHLGLELGLVLCSIAVLTKRKGFWYIGTIVSAAGFMISLLAYLPHLSPG